MVTVATEKNDMRKNLIKKTNGEVIINYFVRFRHFCRIFAPYNNVYFMLIFVTQNGLVIKRFAVSSQWNIGSPPGLEKHCPLRCLPLIYPEHLGRQPFVLNIYIFKTENQMIC